MNQKTAVNPVAAATVLICRDSPQGIEVFMVVRHHQIDFASGALVFPGGKTDKGDYDPRLRARCTAADGLDDEALAYYVSSIREAFEECGVLLARPRGSAALIDGVRLKALEPERGALVNGEIGFFDFLEREDLQLAIDELHPFAHWITPEMVPKRFDTRFYLAKAPSDHVAAHDGSESVDSVWITPNQALEGAQQGTYTVIFPTKLNIMKLGLSQTVDEAIARAGREPIVTVQPWIEQRAEGNFLTIPKAAGYPISEEKVG